MHPKFRLVQNPAEEQQIFEAKKKEATERFDYLIVQALCFSYHKEYFELTKHYLIFAKTGNIDQFLSSINEYKYLFNLGLPSPADTERMIKAHNFVLEDSKYVPNDPEILNTKRIITRLIIRSLMLNQIQSFNELNLLYEDLKKQGDKTDLTLLKNKIKPYVDKLILQDPV